MTFLQALILGIVQGLTEFLPVSSSTHLALARRFMSIEHTEGMVYFDLLCHLGTLLAVFIALRKEIWKALTHLPTFARLTVALLPLIPAYFLFKPLRPLLVDHTGLFLIGTSMLLFFASLKVSAQQPKWRHVLSIGVAQSLALLPGISRSGSTIAMGRLCGWEWADAARFSFLLAIPTILGGTFLETMRSNPVEIAWIPSLIGFLSSFIVGLLALRLLFWILEGKQGLRPFAWYCLGLGLVTSLWLN
jgi:undecaprenyl-diphosphatase